MQLPFSRLNILKDGFVAALEPGRVAAQLACASASSGLHTALKLRVTAGLGNTLSEASRITPKVPSAPTMRRERS